MDQLEFAKQFHLHPAQVGQTTLRWWERWKAWEQASTSRKAHQIAKQSEDITALPREVLDAMTWAIETDDGE